ncbi:MAG: transposase [Sinimarinibacterium flocculans]|uniref:transposase n=1 Tax=Sinimarinibacterium flocculans TaxID=985250 RepID=UPI002EAD1958|nr:transposase [Pseudomonadota bacterium]
MEKRERLDFSGRHSVLRQALRLWTCRGCFARPPKLAPQVSIPFDKFHAERHLGEALDKVRRAEYVRLPG